MSVLDFLSARSCLIWRDSPIFGRLENARKNVIRSIKQGFRETYTTREIKAALQVRIVLFQLEHLKSISAQTKLSKLQNFFSSVNFSFFLRFSFVYLVS